ncbi:hypothetical protein Tco_0004513 [Tanacetum coccineum]
MDEDSIARNLSKVQANLKLPLKECETMRILASSAATLSSHCKTSTRDIRGFAGGQLVSLRRSHKKTNLKRPILKWKFNLWSRFPYIRTPQNGKEAVYPNASVQYAMRAPLRARFKDLPTSDMKEILLQHMLEENYDKGHEDHWMAYEALQKSILHDESEQFDVDKAKERKKMKSKQDSPKTPPESPPPPPPSGASGASDTTGASDSAQDPLPPPQSPTTNPDDQSPGLAAPGSSKTVATTAYTAWITTTSRFEPSASSIPEDVFMHEESDFEAQDMVSDDEDIGNERPATPEPAWSIPSSSLPVPIHNWASALASSYMEECHKLLTNQVDNRLLRYNVSRPLPLGGHPGQVTIQTEFFFNRDLDYLRFGSKGDRLALSITKMKAAYYPDVGLEQMVPDQMWIEEECMYDISATYGISHWWFKRQKFYINRHSAETNRRAIVRTHMRILSVVRIEDLYPSDFEDLYLLNLQGHLNHLPPRDKKILSTAVNLWIRNLVIRQRVEDFQLGIESYQTQLNLTKPRWEATGLEFMHYYKILDSLRAILFRDKYGMHMLMRFNEIHKFSDDTLQQIDEALDYWVKEFKVNKNNQSYKDGKVRYEFPRSRQSQRDLPRDNSLVSVEVLRNRVNTYAVRITWLIADMEDKYHGPSDTLHNPP